MTDAKTRLAEIRARMALPVLPALYAADVPWLLERIARLEWLVRSVEGVFDGDCSTECPFCKYTRGYSDTRHTPDCPAFTPEGEIK